MKKLKQTFKTEVDNKRKTCTGRAKPCKFFNILEEIIGCRPNVHPEFCIDTSAGKKEDDQAEKESGNYIWHL